MQSKKTKSKEITYHVNCDCASYNWTRTPMKGILMRCRGCNKLLDFMSFSVLDKDWKKKQK